MIIIYTDGSASKNGAKDAKGGFGVVVCEGEPNQDPKTYKIIAAHAERKENTTNNRMELSAVIWALKNYGVPETDFFFPLVYSDSMYSVNTFTNWMRRWKDSNWKRSSGRPLENLDLVKEYDRLTTKQGLKIDLHYVKGHDGNFWNEVADKLATGKLTPQQVMEKYGG